MTFTREDAGKTFTYTVQENLPGGVTASNPTAGGYTYDTDVYTVGITPEDNGGTECKVTTGHEVPRPTRPDGRPATLVNTGGHLWHHCCYTPATIMPKVAEQRHASNGLPSRWWTLNNATVATAPTAADGSIGSTTSPRATGNLKAAPPRAPRCGKATLDTTGGGRATANNVVTSTRLLRRHLRVNSGNGSVTVTGERQRRATLIWVNYDNGHNGLTLSRPDLRPRTRSALTNDQGAEPSLLSRRRLAALRARAEDGNAAQNRHVPEVSFGPITYTMENVFGTDTAADETEAAGDEAAETDEGVEAQTAGRTKVFTYTITESADKTLPGVANDSTPKTVEVTVTDNGDGTLAAEVTGVSDGTSTGMDFSFVCTYT